MDINTWPRYLIICAAALVILSITNYYLNIRRQHKLKLLQAALEVQNKSRTPQDILQEYKNNPNHRFLTRSERRYRERLLEKHLKHTWSQGRSRPHSHTHSHRHTSGQDPVKEIPTLQGISRMNRQLSLNTLSQPTPKKSRNISVALSPRLHLLFDKLCIYTALPLLTFCVFCHNLRINLIESHLLQFGEEEESESEGESESESESEPESEPESESESEEEEEEGESESEEESDDVEFWDLDPV